MGVRDADALMLEAEKEIERLRDESASWEEQASDRTDDAVRFIKERDALQSEIDLLRTEYAASRGYADELRTERDTARAERDAAVARYRHVIEILRRDGYWAALMEDDEIDAQVDAARGEKSEG